MSRTQAHFQQIYAFKLFGVQSYKFFMRRQLFYNEIHKFAIHNSRFTIQQRRVVSLRLSFSLRKSMNKNHEIFFNKEVCFHLVYINFIILIDI